MALAKRRGGKLKITIDSAEGATFPWAWYFRDLDVGYIDLTTAGDGAARDRRDRAHPDQPDTACSRRLIGYDGAEIRFRVWWVRDYGKALNPGDWARWFTARKPWNPTGGMPEWVYVRRVVSGG